MYSFDWIFYWSALFQRISFLVRFTLREMPHKYLLILHCCTAGMDGQYMPSFVVVATVRYPHAFESDFDGGYIGVNGFGLFFNDSDFPDRFVIEIELFSLLDVMQCVYCSPCTMPHTIRYNGSFIKHASHCENKWTENFIFVSNIFVKNWNTTNSFV